MAVTEPHQLASYLEAGCKDRSQWLLGTEHEKFGYYLNDLRPLTYEGRGGVRSLLAAMAERTGKLVYELGQPIALDRTDCSITLEPGGQFELSGATFQSVHGVHRELLEHFDELHHLGTEFGIAFAGLGFQPKWRLQDIPKMPKQRYQIMSRYMPQRGQLGLDMMFRTCSAQVNLDYSNEADMVRKFQVSLALQPIITALWACSPFTDGVPNGFQSYRAHTWSDADTARCGDLPFVFENGFGFERYVEYALDVPMCLVHRDGRYHDAAGLSFRDFMAGKLEALPGKLPTYQDWSDHLTTLFPDVRLKRYLEMRGADVGSHEQISALTALYAGLLYDDAALTTAWEMVADWSYQERTALRGDIPRLGLATKFRSGSVLDIAKRMLEIASDGLKARRYADLSYPDESHYLDCMFEIIESGRSPATCLLELYHGRWQGNIDRVFGECRY